MFSELLFGKETGRWVAFVVGAFCSFAAGTLYGFGAYSVSLAEIMGKDTIDFVGSCGDFGVYLGFSFGILFDKFGPTPPAMLGGFLSFSGYFFVWMQASGHLDPTPWTLFPLYFLLGQGSWGLVTAGLSTSLKNFPAIHSGKIASFYVFCYSLSAVILTLVYEHPLHENTVSYLFVMAIMLGVAGILGGYCITLIPVEEEEVVVVGDDKKEKKSQHPENIALTPLLQSMVYVEFWLLFVTFAGVTGAGLLFKNVLGTLAASYNMADHAGGLVVTWTSINAFTRLTVGTSADFFGKTVPRPLFIVVGAFIMFLTHALLIFSTEDYSLWLAAMGTGIGYGSAFALVNSLALIYFSVLDAGMKLSFFVLAPALAGTAATYASGPLTEAASPGGQVTNCKPHDHCYQTTFIMSSGMILVSVVTSCILLYRHIGRMKQKSYHIQYDSEELALNWERKDVDDS